MSSSSRHLELSRHQVCGTVFDGHTLMVGSNNVGKSTICDALDLVLGPDRLNRFPPIDEFDFTTPSIWPRLRKGASPNQFHYASKSS